MTVIMMSNYIYGMTGGQRAPTTPYGATTKTSPLGNEEHPFDMYALVRGAGATFYARSCTTNPIQLQRAIEAGIKHKGFSFIEVLSPLPDYRWPQHLQLQDALRDVRLYESQVCLLKPGETEAPDGKIGLGILYEDNTREELCEVQAEKKEAARK